MPSTSKIFYIISKDLVIKVAGPTRIGRSIGETILEDDTLLSALHAELSSVGGEMFIKDLNSDDGIIVNSVRITPDELFKLSPKDTIQIGSSEYIVYDDKNEVKKIIPKFNKRNEKRPDNLYGIKNFYTFFVAPPLYRSLYFIMILLSMLSLYLHRELDIQVPAHLEFLKTIYDQKIFSSGQIVIAYVLGLSFLHSFLMVVYLNRNPARRIVGLALYLTGCFYFIDIYNGPMGGFRGYLSSRQSIDTMKLEQRAIVDLKSITDYQENLTTAYSFVLNKIRPEDAIVLKKDYELMNKKSDKIIKLIRLKISQENLR